MNAQNKDELNDRELSRYSRQILLPEIDYEGQLKLTQSHIVIFGLGGLGSPASLYLTAAGIGKLTLVDFDEVDDSNLQRQIVHREDNIGQAKVHSAKKNLTRLNHLTQIETLEQIPTEQEAKQLIESADLILDCTDNFKSRFLINRLAFKAKKPLVSGAAIRWEGQLATYDFRQDQVACYQCLYKDTGQEDLTCSRNGIAAPVVGMVGTMQALEAIKTLLGLPNLSGKLMIIDALSMQFRSLNLKPDEHCPICSNPH